MNFQRGNAGRRMVALAIVLGIAIFRWLGHSDGGPAVPQGDRREDHREGTLHQNPDNQNASTIEDAFEAHRSGVWVEASGVVDRILSDDNQGDRHQRFVVRLNVNRTILISHNIDLAERAPVEIGDTVLFRGKYEWNERGGVVHWTHHDPRAGFDRKDRGGWLRVGNTTVR